MSSAAHSEGDVRGGLRARIRVESLIVAQPHEEGLTFAQFNSQTRKTAQTLKANSHHMEEATIGRVFKSCSSVENAHLFASPGEPGEGGEGSLLETDFPSTDRDRGARIRV